MSDTQGPDADLELPGPAPRRSAIVLTQVATAQALAAACALRSVPAVCFDSPVGAWAAVTARGAGEAARLLSASVAGVPLVLLASQVDEENSDGPAGQMAATVWQDGAQVRSVPAALILSGAPDEVEGVLLGTDDVTQLTGGVDSTTLSRWKAARLLATFARRNRPEAR